MIRRIISRVARKIIFKGTNSWSIHGLIKASGVELESLMDVGAHRGNFALEMIMNLNLKEAILFEPNVNLVKESLIPLSQKFSNIFVNNVALGSKSSSGFLNISNNDGLSSSILKMQKLHKMEAKDSNYISESKIRIETLDNYLHDQLSKILIKIDVQGYELEVLNGASKSIERANALLIELSFDDLYEKAPSATTIIDFLYERGFVIYQIFPAFQSGSGRWLQVDALFIRK